MPKTPGAKGVKFKGSDSTVKVGAPNAQMNAVLKDAIKQLDKISRENGDPETVKQAKNIVKALLKR